MSVFVERRRVRAFLAFVVIEAAVVGALTTVGAIAHARGEDARAVNRAVVSHLRLTDLALWSGASYCRHPSQADSFAPYSDHPAAIEHLPAGSVLPPRRRRAASDRDGP